MVIESTSFDGPHPAVKITRNEQVNRIAFIMSPPVFCLQRLSLHQNATSETKAITLGFAGLHLDVNSSKGKSVC